MAEGIGADAGVAERLRSYLHGRRVDAEVRLLGRATVGLSQETWFLELAGDGPSRSVVLRLPTPASGSAAIVTQRAALQAVAGSPVPAPAPLWFDDASENPFGRPFVVMERLPGVVPVGWHEVADSQRRGLAEQAVDALAALHAIDVTQTPLAGAQPSRTVALEGLLGLFVRLEPLPLVLTAALAWLRQARPAASGAPVIVHGDYRMGNLLVEDGRLTGVLDWEMTAPGDRLADLTWCFIPVFELAGIDEEAMVARYAEQAGCTVDPAAWHWFRVLGFARLAYYALAGARVFDLGRSDDLRMAALRLQLPVTLDRLAASLAGEPVH
jgi:aminoglycoside phosphotransferase (APT) family kinase protein